jgi:hypothetical protein
MASFVDLDWSRFDTFALLVGRGIASVEQENLHRASQWLAEHEYAVESLQFSHGISPVVAELGRRLQWQREFGYELHGSSRNLAALHDGFDFQAPVRGGLVLELLRFEVALKEDESWSKGFLSIVAEHSLRQLALGRRFFAMIPVQHEDSPPVGQQYDELAIPYPFTFRSRGA